jgi:hypothetical protein
VFERDLGPVVTRGFSTMRTIRAYYEVNDFVRGNRRSQAS